MTDEDFEVTVSAGALRPRGGSPTTMPHRWTDGGVSIEAPFTGAHLLHVAIAGCVLNDLYREAEALNVHLDGVRVRARGQFDVTTWSSTGITYDVELDSQATPVRRLAIDAPPLTCRRHRGRRGRRRAGRGHLRAGVRRRRVRR